MIKMLMFLLKDVNYGVLLNLRAIKSPKHLENIILASQQIMVILVISWIDYHQEVPLNRCWY